MIGRARDAKYKAEGRSNLIGSARDAKYTAEGGRNLIGSKRTANTKLKEQTILLA